MRTRRCILMMSMIAVLYSPAAAQTPADTTRTAVLATAASRSWHLRLTMPSASAEGRVLRVYRDTVQIVGDEIPIDAVIRIERRLKSGGGLVPGAVTGGLVVGAIAFGLAGLCESDCDFVQLGAFGLGALVGGVVGGLAGTLVAPPEVTWRHLWGSTR